MLRILVFSLVVSNSLHANEIQEAKKKSLEALEESKKYQLSEEFKETLKEERSNLSKIDTSSTLEISLPKDFKPLGDEYKKLLEAAKKVPKEPVSSTLPQVPIILVSFSMPDIEIKNLIYEAHKVGAVVAIRGLHKDSFEETYKKIASFFEKNDEVGILIDPTLFKRFQVKTVPTFILPLEQISPCSDEGCPTEEHVKATGSVSLDYFLDFIQRTGTKDQVSIASRWLQKLRGGQSL